MSTPVLPFLLATAACLVCSTAASASEKSDLRSSVNRVERETGGRVLSAERRSQAGREVNRIKVYTPEGRVRVMWDDPRGEAPRNASPPPRHEPAPEPRQRRERDEQR